MFLNGMFKTLVGHYALFLFLILLFCFDFVLSFCSVSRFHLFLDFLCFSFVLIEAFLLLGLMFFCFYLCFSAVVFDFLLLFRVFLFPLFFLCLIEFLVLHRDLKRICFLAWYLIMLS